MKKDKIIITLNNLDDKKKLEEIGITKFAYPLKDFCVGIPNSFSWEDIPSDAYLFLNRIMDNEAIDKLQEILAKITFKGIIFDDLGLIPLLQSLNKEVEKILYLSHFNANQEAIAIYLKYVDSVIVCTDITRKEIDNIVANFQDKLTAFTLGYVGSMYSRRLLIDNYCKFYHTSYTNPLVINNTNHKFLVYENQYGTYFYHMPLFNGLELMELPFKYYFINMSFLTINDLTNLLTRENGKDIIANIIACDKNFLYQETIYKLKEGSNNETD